MLEFLNASYFVYFLLHWLEVSSNLVYSSFTGMAVGFYDATKSHPNCDLENNGAIRSFFNCIASIELRYHSFSTYAKFSEKQTFLTCYLFLNVSFSENFAYGLN